MKTTRSIITAGIIIFWNVFCYAQQLPLSYSDLVREEKAGIDSSAYIFEGTIIKQATVDEGQLVCSVFSITKIYRGSPQIKLGTIKVITGAGGDDDPSDLYKGSHYIFFGKLTNSTAFKSIVTDNSLAVTWGGAPVLFSGKDGATWGIGINQIHYKTLDELNNYLKENGLTVQEEVAPADSAKQK